MKQKDLDKMLRLADIKPMADNRRINNSTIELIKKGADGKAYGVVRENRKYFIKTADLNGILKEEDFDFIGGIQNKSRYSYRGYDEAIRHLNIMFESLNRSYNINEQVNMAVSDLKLNEACDLDLDEAGMDTSIKAAAAHARQNPGEDKEEIRKKFDVDKRQSYMDDDEEEIDESGMDTSIKAAASHARQNPGEDKEEIRKKFDVDKRQSYMDDDEEETLNEKRYVLKQPKPAPVEEPMDFGGDTEEGAAFDFGGEGETEGGDDFDFEGGDDFDFEGGDELDTELDTEIDDGDPIKSIQKTTGKLGQELRDTEDVSSDLQKWVAKSVISALDLDTMETSDKQDIINAVKDKGGDEGESEDIDFMADEDRAGERYDTEDLLFDEYETYEEELAAKQGGMDYMGDDTEYMDYMGDTSYMDYDYDTSTEEEALYGTDYEKYSRDPNYRAMKQADKDISTHYSDPAAPGYETDPSDAWRGHKLPYDTDMDIEFMSDVDEGMSKWDEPDGDEGGMSWMSEDDDYVDYMTDDDMEDVDINDEYPIDKYINNEDSLNKNYMDYMDYMAEPAPTKEPATKPTTEPDTPVRPSRRPFAPPPHITPGEEPGPKAGYDDVEFE